MMFCSFFSQILLCVIFWELSAVEPKTQEVETPDEITETEPAEVRLEAWDPEASLQARIWNKFVR